MNLSLAKSGKSQNASLMSIKCHQGSLDFDLYFDNT